MKGLNIMKFVEPEMNVRAFVAEDIITTSIEKPGNTGNVGGTGGDD